MTEDELQKREQGACNVADDLAGTSWEACYVALRFAASCVPEMMPPGAKPGNRLRPAIAWVVREAEKEARAQGFDWCPSCELWTERFKGRCCNAPACNPF